MEVDEINAAASTDTPMEVDDDISGKTCSTSANPPSATKVMASSGTVASVSVSIHPLVVMNISEHWTRVRVQKGADQLVYGGLIGQQKGRNLEIMNSFEVMYTCIGDDVIVNREYFGIKAGQYKNVFREMDFLGWYTTGDMPNERDIGVHKQFCKINENPVLLKLDPRPKNTDQLPVTIYESVIDLVNGEATMLFVPLTYTVVTEEAERIGLDHVARLCSNDQGENSLVAEHLTAQHSAIKMLHSRVKLILKYVQAVQSGELKGNHEVLRAACSLGHRLPVLNNQKFEADFYNQCNESALVTYLGIMTKGCNNINQFVNKFNILYDRQGVGRRLRSLFL